MNRKHKNPFKFVLLHYIVTIVKKQEGKVKRTGVLKSAVLTGSAGVWESVLVEMLTVSRGNLCSLPLWKVVQGDIINDGYIQ